MNSHIFIVLYLITLGNAALASNAVECVNANNNLDSVGTIRYFNIRTGRLHPCSGVAITTRHILAPARCVIWMNQTDSSFRVKTKTHRVEQIFIHPKYTLDSTDHSIAILQLRDDLKVSSCLPLAEDVKPVSLIARRFDVVTIGLYPGSTKSQQTTKITSHAYCQRKFEGLAITENEVCAHIPSDSPVLMGSALLGIHMENGTESWNLLGISLHAVAENNPQITTLFTLIPAHRKWIEEIINL